MGKLLANPKSREKVVQWLKKNGGRLAVLSYAVGVVWMLALPHHELSARNYFSENQLLPGLVDTYFPMSQYTRNMFRTLQTTRREGGREAVKNLLLKEFFKLSFDIHEQNFHVDSLRHNESPGVVVNGSNVFGILRAPRASGVESIVLNVPLHDDGSSLGSLALMLGIASYFRDQTYWAKDIIFLVTEYELVGMQAWLNGYFQDTTPGIRCDNLRGHGGSIQAAIVLDFPSEVVNHFDILFVGANGLLPNLDFINLVSRIASLEGVASKFQYQSELFRGKDQYMYNLETLLRLMATQSSGYPSGNHGLFYKYRIEAVTLQGVNNPLGRYRKQAPFEAIGRMTEGIFRSINNMLEHFHQSFFLYVLPNSHTYISIGMYMPPLACLTLPICLHLVLLWIRIFKLDEGLSDITHKDKDGEVSETKHEKESVDGLENEDGNTDSTEIESPEDDGDKDPTIKSSENGHDEDAVLITMSPLLDSRVLKQIFLSFTLSLCCYFGLDHYFNNIINTSTTTSQLFTVLSVSCFGAVGVAILLTRQQTNTETQGKQTDNNMEIRGLNHNLRFFGLLHLLLIIAVVAVFNFSAAFVTALFYVPLAITTATATNKYTRVVQVLLTMLSSPCVVVGLVVVASDVSVDDFWTFDWVGDSVGQWHEVMVEAHVNKVVPVWTKDVIYLTVLPMWITLSSIR